VALNTDPPIELPSLEGTPRIVIIRYIPVIEFWYLKPGVRHILSSNARKCARKVCFYKPCTASEVNRILRLKVSVLVYTVSRLSKCHG